MPAWSRGRFKEATCLRMTSAIIVAAGKGTLIVEDEAKMRRLLELNLGEDGFKTLSAGDAETGLKMLASETVDLVLTDLKLPAMSGLELLQAAKQQNAALPVVVMTAFGAVISPAPTVGAVMTQ